MKLLCLTFPVVLQMLLSLPAIAAELISLETRDGVEQKFIWIKPDAAKASVILFAGGKGTLGLSSAFAMPSINRGMKNFLVRTRNLFVKNGFQVAVVDAPSDRQSSTGMLGGFRGSSDHIEDIDHVIQFLRAQEDIPVWLIGTSRGTESAANVAINSTEQPDGLVLTSSISVENSTGTAITEMDLNKITIPTLIVANTDDKCLVTPAHGADKIASMLGQARLVKVKKFSGGDKPTSRPCKAMSYHGFIGIEKNVVGYIARFIKSN